MPIVARVGPGAPEAVMASGVAVRLKLWRSPIESAFRDRKTLSKNSVGPTRNFARDQTKTA